MAVLLILLALGGVVLVATWSPEGPRFSAASVRHDGQAKTVAHRIRSSPCGAIALDRASRARAERCTIKVGVQWEATYQRKVGD
jgi:hypothetical protein